jgi:hypothetical protein
MPYLYVKQKVRNFNDWHRVFKSHEGSHKDVGLKDLKLLRDANDETTIVCLFYVDDIESARAFTEAPEAEDAQLEAGIIGIPEILFLEEI